MVLGKKASDLQLLTQCLAPSSIHHCWMTRWMHHGLKVQPYRLIVNYRGNRYLHNDKLWQIPPEPASASTLSITSEGTNRCRMPLEQCTGEDTASSTWYFCPKCLVWVWSGRNEEENKKWVSFYKTNDLESWKRSTPVSVRTPGKQVLRRE